MRTSVFAALLTLIVAVGQPRDGYVGSMSVAPVHGKAGDPFTVTATDLPPNQEFQLIWRTVNGQWNVTESEYKGREFVPVNYQMARVRSNAAGRLQATSRHPKTSASTTTSSCSRATAC